jgi:hypothetical protein
MGLVLERRVVYIFFFNFSGWLLGGIIVSFVDFVGCIELHPHFVLSFLMFALN